MKLKFHKTKKDKVVEVISDDVFSSVDEFRDIMEKSNFRGATAVIMYKKNIHEDFFDLETKLADEIHQELSDFEQKLAIIGDFNNNKSVNDLNKESNKLERLLFLSNIDEAIEKLGL